MLKKKVIPIVLAVFMVLSLTACNGGKAIGFIGSLTGPYEVYGKIGRGAAEMAVDHINEQGGILGRKVVLKVYDNQSEAIETTNVARKAILQDKVVAFVGPDASAALIALSPVCEEYGVPSMAYAGSSINITKFDNGSTRPYNFRVNTAAHQATGVMAQYSVEKLGLKKFAALYDVTTTAGVDGLKYFEAGLNEAGGEIVTSEGYKTGDIDFRAQLSAIKNVGGIDAIYVPAQYTELGLIANQARELGIDTMLIGDRGWMMTDVFDIAKDNLEGSYFNCDIDPTEERFADFTKEFEERYGYNPAVAAGNDAYFCYDCFLVIKNAIEKAGVTDPKAISESIEKNTQELKVLTTNLTINPETHNAYREMTIFKIENQKFIKVEDYRINIG